MGDVEKDAERVIELGLSGSDKIRIASGMNSFMIKVFRERIRREHPDASNEEITRILREELSR